MTDLQTSLIVIGGVIVVGVISYNKWQEHKTRKSVERAFSSDHDDVLMHSHADAEQSFAEPAAAPQRHTPMYAEDRLEPGLGQIPELRQATRQQQAERSPAAFPESTGQFQEADEPYLSLQTLADSHTDYPTEPLGGEDLDTDLSHVAATLADPTILAEVQFSAPAPAAVLPDLPVDEL